MKKLNRLLLSLFLLLMFLSSTMIFKSAEGADSSKTLPVVAINVSEYTEAHWAYTSWKYLAIYRMLEAAFISDGTPFVEISDAAIESGGLLVSGAPKYPILFSLASECVSDLEASQISTYVSAGGFAYVGSSSWTKYEDGSPRSDFALSSQMGLSSVNPPPDNNWVQVQNAIRIADNRLVNHVPKDVTINWQLPLTDHTVLSLAPPADHHYAWDVQSTSSKPAQVLMTIDNDVMLAARHYQQGMFIYHSELAPLASFSVYTPEAYEYMFFRQAVEWAFENQNIPLAKLSAWPYQYDSAFILRHDMDLPQFYSWIDSSASYERSIGVTGQYYIVTGDVRDAANSAYLISLIQQAQSLGAMIGSHNGGLNCTPWNPSLTYNDYGYYHWGPDDAIAYYPTGMADGFNYAATSVSASLDDLQSWLGQRPQIWAAPSGRGVWEESFQLMDSLGIKTSGEFTTSPYPNFAFSLSDNTVYNVYEVPFSRWIGSDGTVFQSMDEMADAGVDNMQQLVDFYYNMGALVSPYCHSSSESGLPHEFLQDVLAKPYMWNTNPLELRDWGVERQQVQSTEQYTLDSNGVNNLTVALTGSSSTNTALDIVLPVNDSQIMNLQVLLDGTPTANYRLTDSGLKVQAGMSSKVTVLYSIGTSDSWVQTSQADFQAGTLTNLDAESVPGQLTLAQTSLFSDDFSDSAWTSSHWTARSGFWLVSNGFYNVTGQSGQLSSIYISGSSWSDFAVETKVQYVRGEYTGELSARVSSITGSRYSFMLCPNQTPGPNKALLMKFSSWADMTGSMLGEVTLPMDTNWHIVRMELNGNNIKAYYDGSLVFNVVDSSYSSGSVALETFGDSVASFDWLNVISLTYPSSGTLLSSAFDSTVDSAGWNTISWNASAPAGTNLIFKTRTADTQSGLTSASWSNNYVTSNSTITSPNKKWIQYQATLSTSDNLVTPVLFDVTITYSYTAPAPSGTVYITLYLTMTATVSEPTQPQLTISNIPQDSVINETFANENNCTSASNDSNTFPSSADQSQLSLNSMTLLPLSLGAVEASTVLSIGLFFKQKKQVSCMVQKFGFDGYRFSLGSKYEMRFL